MQFPGVSSGECTRQHTAVQHREKNMCLSGFVMSFFKQYLNIMKHLSVDYLSPLKMCIKDTINIRETRYSGFQSSKFNTKVGLMKGIFNIFM